MKVPVPDDYSEGDGLSCFQVWWPDTPQWIALLHGFISSIGHGRFWDENTGVIKDAQAVAREIWERTIPLMGCDDCSGDDNDNGSLSDSSNVGAIIDAFGDVFMSNCSIPYGSLKWVNGVLYFRYCGEWYPVEGAAPGDVTLPQPGDDDYVEIPDDTFGVPTPCSQAAAIHAIMVDVIDSMLDDALVPEDPSVAIQNAKARQPSIDFGDLELLSCYISAVAIRVAGFASETEDQTVQQAILCRMAEAAPGGPGGWDQDARADVQKAIVRGAEQYFTILTYPLSYNEMINIWLHSYRSIGANDTVKVTQLAVSTGAENCDCPGTPGDDLSAFDWDYKYDLTQDAQGWQHSGIDGAWIDGSGYRSRDSGGLDLRRSGWTDNVNSFLTHISVTINAVPGTVDTGYGSGVRHQNTSGFTQLIDAVDMAAGSGEYVGTQNLPLSFDADNILMQLAVKLNDQPSGHWYVERIRLAGFGTPPTAAPTHPYT